MTKRVALVFRHIAYNLRGGFLVRPLSIALTLGAAGALSSWLEEARPAIGAWVPAFVFPSRADPQVAQVILSGIASSIMTVVSIVFAILLMTLTLASMQFSPRIIVSFARDRVTQWTLGIFLGTFCYCTAALPAARDVPQPFSPVVTVLGAMLLAVACVGLLLFFIHHISEAISVNHIVDRIAAETVAVIDETMPRPRVPNRSRDMDPAELVKWETPLLTETSGYIRFIDIDRVVTLTKRYRVKVKALHRIGHFVPAGVPFLMVSRGERLTPGCAAAFHGAFDFGPSRTLQQDVEFGVLQIVDIALKAISPAVNDPSTAITCVDQLSRILIRYASREPPETTLYDPPGVVRVSIPWISFERLLASAFGQIRTYASADVAVSLRLLRALCDIATTTIDPTFRGSLVNAGRRVLEGCTRKLVEEELREVRIRLRALETMGPDCVAPSDGAGPFRPQRLTPIFAC